LRLNAPKKKVFLICVIAAAVAVVAFIVGSVVAIPVLSYIAVGVLLAAFVVLMLGNVLKGF
jgi:hypothetical protein